MVFVMLYTGSIAVIATLLSLTTLFLLLAFAFIMWYAIYAVTSKAHSGLKGMVLEGKKELLTASQEYNELSRQQAEAAAERKALQQEERATKLAEAEDKAVLDTGRYAKSANSRLSGATKGLKNVAKRVKNAVTGPNAPQKVAAVLKDIDRYAGYIAAWRNSTIPLRNRKVALEKIEKQVTARLRATKNYVNNVQRLLNTDNRKAWFHHRQLVYRHRDEVYKIKQAMKDKKVKAYKPLLAKAKELEEKLLKYEKQLEPLAKLTKDDDKKLNNFLKARNSLSDASTKKMKTITARLTEMISAENNISKLITTMESTIKTLKAAADNQKPAQAAKVVDLLNKIETNLAKEDAAITKLEKSSLGLAPTLAKLEAAEKQMIAITNQLFPALSRLKVTEKNMQAMEAQVQNLGVRLTKAVVSQVGKPAKGGGGKGKGPKLPPGRAPGKGRGGRGPGPVVVRPGRGQAVVVQPRGGRGRGRGKRP
jgi:hypothetical protein